MFSDIRNVLSALQDLRGLRNILWALLLIGLGLVIFESATQYFAVSSLQTRTELLGSLSEIDSSSQNKQEIALLHSDLIEETKEVYRAERRPDLYLLSIFRRFFQGAYLSLPLFYFFFKGVPFILRNAGEELKNNAQAKQMAVMLGSLVFSAAVWMATLLGVASVVWNKTDSLLVAWVIFPVSSAIILMILSVWLVALRILMPGRGSRKKIEE